MSTHDSALTRPLRLTALTAVVGLVAVGCTAEPDPDPTATETVTATADPTSSEDPEPTEDTSSEPSETDAPTETFTTQGGTFSFDVPTDWTAETTEYQTDNVEELTGVPYEVVDISSPQGDISISVAVHNGPTSGDGWRSQYWELLDAEELTDLPLHEARQHNYLRTGLEWLGEDDENIDPEQMGWDGGDYRMTMSVVSQDEDLQPGETDQQVRLAGWAYWTPLPGDWQGETSFIGVTFSQELIESLTGETEQDAAVAAFQENEWYQTTRDILASMHYEEPAEEDLPILE
ncbi:MAG: hypothetical protein ACTHZ5_13445 [Micrococcaceae bacterium]